LIGTFTRPNVMAPFQSALMPWYYPLRLIGIRAAGGF
jgi:hypothetical protein